MGNQGLFATLLGNPVIAMVLFGIALIVIAAVAVAIRQAYRNTRTRATLSPLMKAIVERRADDASRLMSTDTVNAQTALGDTALIFAAQWGDINVAKKLLGHGADPTPQGDGGMTALQHAALGGHTDLVVLLLASGAHLNVRDEQGSSALTYSVLSGNAELVETLLARGADVSGNPLITAATHNNAAIVRLLVQHGADINVNANTAAPTPLHLAVEYKNAELVEFLLSRGADVHAKYYVAAISEPRTPLHSAMLERDNRIIEMLENAIAQPPKAGGSVSAETQSPNASPHSIGEAAEDQLRMIAGECGACGDRVEGAYLRSDEIGGSMTTLGCVCPNCQTLYCFKCRRPALKWSLWSGFEKTTCPKCNNSLANRDWIVDPSEARSVH